MAHLASGPTATSVGWDVTIVDNPWNSYAFECGIHSARETHRRIALAALVAAGVEEV